MKGMESLRHEFADEMSTIIAGLRQELRAWSDHPEGENPLQNVLRGLHTVKGSSGLMELKPLADLCHQLESVIAPQRNEEGHPPQGAAFFDAVEDTLGAMVQALEALRAGEDYTPIIVRTKAALEAAFPSEGAPKVTRLLPRPTEDPKVQPLPPPLGATLSPSKSATPAFFSHLDEGPGSPPPAETPSATERDMVSTLLRLLTVDESGEAPSIQRPPGQPTFNPLGFETQGPRGDETPPSVGSILRDARRGTPRRQPPPRLVDDRLPKGDTKPTASPLTTKRSVNLSGPQAALAQDVHPPEEEAEPEPPPPAQSWPEVPVHRWPSPERDLPLIGERNHNVIRVDVQKLDILLDLFGDLTQQHNRLARVREAMELGGPNSLAGDISEIHRTMGLQLLELKDAVIRTRMLPIHTVFRRYPSMVESMAQGLGREVSLIIEGGDAEMDRSIIESLYQPLVHILRNAVTHGIEEPAERRRRNKPRRGVVTLKAEQSGTMMSIEVKDDGKGLDPSAIANRAVSQGLVSDTRLERMGDIERQNLIFLPGMTSSEDVTEVSGRGLGMDTVRAQLGRLGGRIEVESKVGEGTTFRLMVPLTLAIIQTVMARVGELTFGLPASAVLGVERGNRDNIHAQGGGWLLRRANGPVPIHSLGYILGLHESAPPPARCHVATIGVAEARFAIWADRFDGLYECVIKPLTTKTTALPGVLGGTSTGTGDMTLILDPAALNAFFNKD